MQQFSVEFNRDYGLDNRTGWTVCVNGIVVAALERRLLVALFRGWKTHREIKRSLRDWIDNGGKRNMPTIEPCSGTHMFINGRCGCGLEVAGYQPICEIGKPSPPVGGSVIDKG